MIDVMRYANYNLDDENFDIETLIELLDIRQTKYPHLYNNMIKNLNDLGFYPVYNMPGHRGTHHFPTEAECELWEDYLYQCKE